MKKIKPLEYKFLRKKLKISHLDFLTTKKLEVLDEFVGQERALEALKFGIKIKNMGYNLYAMGPSGIGKKSLVQMMLNAHAAKCSVPPDWCYIHNFDVPEKPIAISITAGKGIVFQQDMKNLLDDLSEAIVTVFGSFEYKAGRKKIASEFNLQRRRTDKVVQTKKRKISHLYHDRNEKEKIFQTRLISASIIPLIDKKKRKYAKFPQILKYLRNLKKDIIEHVNDFIKYDEKSNLISFALENPLLNKYKINLLVDNSKLKGAPVVFEDSPCYSHLICRVEHTTESGNLTTNFMLIRPGSLHKANGGYLIIEARKLRKKKQAWEALKNALFTQTIKIEPIQDVSDTIKTISLEPMSIPLNVKIVLLGVRNTYYNFCQQDPDFTELFKVPVDFDEQINRNKKNIALYARLIATIVHREKLLNFHVSAVAAIIDHSSRLAEDREKLSTHMRDIQDLILEANYWALQENKKTVHASDVKRALKANIYRMDRARELYYEDIFRDFIHIKTYGKIIGQINCLSVRKVGNFSYGHPTRITARVRQGKGHLIDIQREIKLSGPLHNKAGLIITNFLASRFNSEELFPLSASLAFEQIYCWTDGDSASVGELCALLSALADIPLNQNLAVTGSIDQYGVVQAVGGINEKIEGFFDICNEKGLTDTQGVIIPGINAKNLMLRDDVVEAAKLNKFFIYPIATIDEAIFLLSGVMPGKRESTGNYQEQSFYYKVEEKLRLFTRNRLKNK